MRRHFWEFLLSSFQIVARMWTNTFRWIKNSSAENITCFQLLTWEEFLDPKVDIENPMLKCGLLIKCLLRSYWFFLFSCFHQGVVTPQVSVQGYQATPGTVQAAQSGTTFKKSRFVHRVMNDVYPGATLRETIVQEWHEQYSRIPISLAVVFFNLPIPLKWKSFPSA